MLRVNLIETIRCVHAGQRKIPAEIATELAEHRDSDDLSPREIEVLRHAAAGSSNKIIAERLGLTEQTVKGYMKSVFAKLGANDRTHAVMIAMKRGFLDA
jgi:DNA-binding NarL/FixJ family response regulator